MTSYNIDNVNRTYPYICFKISNGEFNYPVMGLFVNEHVVIDILWENFISLIESDSNNGKSFPAKKVSFYNECGRDVVIKFKPEKSVFSFYIGYYEKELNNPHEAEYSCDIKSLDVGFEAQRFGYLAENWINEQIQ